MVIVAALVTAGCGGDDDSSKTSSPNPTEAASPEEQAVVDAALLELSDFPSGWSQRTAEDEEDPREEDRQRAIAECMGVDFERLYGEDVSADSPTFVSPGDEEISSSAGIEDTEEDARFVVETLATDKALTCIAEQLQAFMEERSRGEDAEIGTVAVDRMSFTQLGDRTDAYRITVPIKAEGLEVDAYFDIASVRVGRAGATVQAFSVITPFDTAQLEELTATVVDRLTRGLEDAGI